MHKKNKFAVAIFSVLFMSACSQIESRHEIEERGGFDENKGTSAATNSAQSTMAHPSLKDEKKVAVILGPGGYKAFAHTGVLKELRKKNIPISRIVGFEWGALVAGLYAQRGQVNEAEWKLYKLEKLNLEGTGFFGGKKEAHSMKELAGFLQTNLDIKDMASAAVPFSCPSLSLAQGSMVWQEQGPLATAVENCMGYPPLFNPQGTNVAELFAYEDVITRLKQQGYNVIILVNVLGDGNLFDNPAKADYASAVLWAEARRAIWRAKSQVTDVIEVNTRGIGLLDFDSRKLLVTAGEAAGEQAAKQLSSRYGF